MANEPAMPKPSPRVVIAAREITQILALGTSAFSAPTGTPR